MYYFVFYYCNNYFLSVRIDCRCISKGFIIFRQSIYAYSNSILFNLRHIRNFLGLENYRLLYANYFSRKCIYFCCIIDICIFRG